MVITGAAGFLGAAVVRRLAEGGHDVQAWVRAGASLERFADVPVLIHRYDLGQLGTPAGRDAARLALDAFRPEAVVHCAWLGTRAADYASACQVENVTWTIELLRAAAAVDVKRFVGIGSQAEYGPQPGVITEETLPAPATLYGAAKLACGQLTLALASALGVSAAWVRVFSVYGPRDRAGTLIEDLTVARLEGHPFVVGDLDRRWDYLYEDDAGEALARLAVRREAVGVFNLASGRALPLREVVARIQALVGPGANAPVGTRPPVPTDLPRLEADVTKLRSALAWTPEVDLDSGLARTVAAITARRRRIAAEG